MALKLHTSPVWTRKTLVPNFPQTKKQIKIAKEKLHKLMEKYKPDIKIAHHPELLTPSQLAKSIKLAQMYGLGPEKISKVLQLGTSPGKSQFHPIPRALWKHWTSYGKTIKAQVINTKYKPQVESEEFWGLYNKNDIIVLHTLGYSPQDIQMGIQKYGITATVLVGPWKGVVGKVVEMKHTLQRQPIPQWLIPPFKQLSIQKTVVLKLQHYNLIEIREYNVKDIGYGGKPKDESGYVKNE